MTGADRVKLDMLLFGTGVVDQHGRHVKLKDFLMSNRQELEWVQSGSDEGGICYAVGSAIGPNTVSSIEKTATGRGPAGYYDVITVRFDQNKTTIVIPAHMATAWGTQ